MQEKSKRREVGLRMLGLLRDNGALSRETLVRRCETSPTTIKRATAWLKQQGVQLHYDAPTRKWRLEDPDIQLPLLEPKPADLTAMLTAAGLLRELQLTELSARTWALFDELQGVVTSPGDAIRRDALRVSQTSASLSEPRWVVQLLRAVRTRVVEVEYRRPWGTAGTHLHKFEPWQLWLHDGVLYVRGYSRTRKGPRTLRLANIRGLRVLPDEGPKHAVPDEVEIWGNTDPRWGIDEHEPDTAVVQLRGEVARWVAGAVWAADQEDKWLDRDELLQRTVKYRSCREMARRLVPLSDGIVALRPRRLLQSVQSLAAGAADISLLPP